MRATQEPDILGASVAAESVRVVVMELQGMTLGTSSTVCTHEGKTNHPRTNVEDPDTSPGVRGIAAAVKRFAWDRDGGQLSGHS